MDAENGPRQAGGAQDQDRCEAEAVPTDLSQACARLFRRDHAGERARRQTAAVAAEEARQGARRDFYFSARGIAGVAIRYG